MALAGGALLILGAFALGAVPWGVVLGKLFTGVDLRRHGSGSTGTTNALRVLGWRISVLVFVLDFLKGLLPVLVAQWMGANGWVTALAGVAATAGHCWSPFIRFRGGKGMATGGGAAVGMVPWLILTAVAMAVIVLLTRYVSLASIASAILVSLLLVFFGLRGWLSWQTVVAVVAMASIIVIQHRGNIRRLLNGTERRIGERPTAA